MVKTPLISAAFAALVLRAVSAAKEGEAVMPEAAANKKMRR